MNKTHKIKCVVCSDCPCLNCGDEESICNLGYKLDYVIRTGYISTDCKLEEIKSNGLFKPEWVEIEQEIYEPVECTHTPIELLTNEYFEKKLREESVLNSIFSDLGRTIYNKP